MSTLWKQRLSVNREILREPFSIQAFIACPFVILLAISQAATSAAAEGWEALGTMIGLLGAAWYLWARTKTFVAVNGGKYLPAFGFVFASFLLTSALIGALVIAIVL